MTREGTSRDAYTGHSGQLAVLAELLARGINVAVPVIDEGEDVLAFRVDVEDVARLQVKSATAEPLKDGRYAARFSVPLVQLEQRETPKLHYVFAIRLGQQWVDFLVIPRKALFDQLRTYQVGHRNPKAGQLQLYLAISPLSILCSGQDWQPFRGAWHLLPAGLLAEPAPGAWTARPPGA